MTDQHDYKAGIDWIDDKIKYLKSCEGTGHPDWEMKMLQQIPTCNAIRRALLIADKLQQEGSEEVLLLIEEKGRGTEYWTPSHDVLSRQVFRDICQQINKEVDQELGE